MDQAAALRADGKALLFSVLFVIMNSVSENGRSFGGQL
jgi:hypothetical protein